MPARTLLIPSGLYREKLCKVVDKAVDVPEGLLKRDPLATTVYVTVRPAEYHEGADMVDAVYSGAAERRLPLQQTVGDDGQFTLHCDDFEVKILPLFHNLDILARCGAFMSAAIQILDIAVPDADSLNLQPLENLNDWWIDPNASLPDTTNWAGIAPWIREEFETRQVQITKLRADQPNRPLKVPPPQCYQPLCRELLLDEDLSRALVNKLSAKRKRLAPHLSLSDYDLATTELAERCKSVFRNAHKYLVRCLAAGDNRNWFGFVFEAAWRSAQRTLQRDAGVRLRPQLPRKQCRELLDELLEAIGKTPEVGDTIDGYVRDYLANLKGKKPSAKIAAYYAAKKRYAIAHDYLSQRAVRKFSADGLTPANLLRARLGLLAAVDRWCHNAILAGAAGAPSAFAFEAYADGIMKEFIRSGVDDMDALLVEDGEIMKCLSEAYTPRAGHLDLAEVPDDPQRDPIDQHLSEDQLRSIRAQFKLARLSQDEQLSVLLPNRIRNVANQEEAKATCAFFGISWPLPDNRDDLTQNLPRIKRKLKQAVERRLPNGALRFLIRQVELDEATVRAMLYRYDILREGLSVVEKDSIRAIFGIEPCMGEMSDEKVEESGFKEVEKCRKRIASNGRLGELFREAKLEVREAQAALCALRIIDDKLPEEEKQKIRHNFGIEPVAPDVADSDEREALWNRAFRKLNGDQETFP